MDRRARRLVLAALSPFALARRALAGTTGAAFLSNDQTPQAVAMGGSGVVASWGSQAMGANPANLGRMSTRMEIYTSYSAPIEGEQFGRLSAAVALGSSWIDAIGASVIGQRIGGLIGTDSSGNQTGGTFGSGDLAASLGFSGRITDDLRYGAAVKSVRETIASYASNTALAADAGWAYDTGVRGLSVGMSVNNAGQKIKFLDQGDDLPLTINAGAMIPLGNFTAAAALGRLVHEQQTNISLGVSYQFGIVDLRAGYLAQTGGQGNPALRDQSGLSRAVNGVSGGVGVGFESVRLDYAINEGAADLGLSQVVSLTIGWGAPPAAEKARPAVRTAPPPAVRPVQVRPQGNGDSSANGWYLLPDPGQ